MSRDLASLPCTFRENILYVHKMTKCSRMSDADGNVLLRALSF